MIYNNYNFKVPKEATLRVITNTDAKNEVDDQFCIVHTLLTPRFDNVGMIAAHFGKMRTSTPTMEESYDELVKVFDIMKLDKSIIYKGAEKAIQDDGKPQISEGAQLIIDEAMKDDPRPLFVTFLGPLTDLASAYLMEPRIANRLTCIWIGGGTYPTGGGEFNLGNDINAANIVFKSSIPVWQVPRNVYQMMLVSTAELEYHVRPYGEIGKYLYDQFVEWMEKRWKRLGDKGSYMPYCECWCLGDSPVVGLMLSDHQHDFEWLSAPEFGKNMEYIHTGQNRPIRVYKNINARFVLEDFYSKLKIDSERKKSDDA